MLHGMNPTVFVFLPMLGLHPEAYPRFRDAFIGKVSRDMESEIHPLLGPDKKIENDEEFITVYTRTGGEHRQRFIEENKIMSEHPCFVETYDDEFDNTFAFWIFKIPEKWQSDYAQLFADTDGIFFSEEYKNEIRRIYPTLDIDSMFEMFETLPVKSEESEVKE